MQRRALFSLVNLAVAAGALVVFFLFPRYAGYALYAFLGWFLVGFSLIWATRGAAPVPVPSAAPAGTGPAASAPLPSAGAGPAGRSAGGASAPPVGFCIYCAADLPAGADRCDACGHARARLTPA